MDPNESEYLTPRQLAGKLNMSLKWVEKHTQGHRIPGQVKIGRAWRYDWIEVQKKILSGQLLLDRGRSKRHDQ